MKILTSAVYIARALVTVRGTNRDQCHPLVPIRATNRDQMSLFSSPKGGKQRPLVLVGGTNQYQRWALVPVGGTNRYQRRALVPVCTTNRDQRPCTAAWWWEFSPTSLAEREPHLFIRCGAPELSSSSLKQAYGPNLSIHACGPTGPSAGLNPGPWMGF